MSFQNYKIYPLPSGETVVSYMDTTKRKRTLKKFSSEVEAREFYQSIRATNTEGQSKAESNTGFLLRAYLKERPDCYLAQSGILRREFLSAFEVYSPSNLTESVLRSFLVQLKNENDYSDRSMLRTKSMLQGFFKYLIEKDLIENSPLENIKFDRGAPFKRKPIALPKTDVKNFIQIAKKFSPALFYPIFVLISETAAKTSDILNLKWRDLNLKTGSISLVHSKDLQPRNFVMSEELMNAIKRVQPIGNFVFTSLEGKPLQKHILSRELKRLQRRTQLSAKWGLIDLRASFAAHFLQSGGSIKNLQKIMGHKTYHNTESVYGSYRVTSTTGIQHEV
jgi:integrase